MKEQMYFLPTLASDFRGLGYFLMGMPAASLFISLIVGYFIFMKGRRKWWPLLALFFLSFPTNLSCVLVFVFGRTIFLEKTHPDFLTLYVVIGNTLVVLVNICCVIFWCLKPKPIPPASPSSNPTSNN